LNLGIEAELKRDNTSLLEKGRKVEAGTSF